jgi:hypothetical protein
MEIFDNGISNNKEASITSKTLFIKFAESTEIFLPIFHLGCLVASAGLTVFKFIFLLKKGPPEAVKNIFLILFLFLFSIKL